MMNTTGPSPESADFRSKPQASHWGRTRLKPLNSGPRPHPGHRHSRPARKGFGRALAPVTSGEGDVDEGEQEQPDHVDEVPVPGGRLEAEVLLRRELAGEQAQQADAE